MVGSESSIDKQIEHFVKKCDCTTACSDRSPHSREVAASDYERRELDDSQFQNASKVVAVCGGLVAIVSESVSCAVNDSIGAICERC